MLFSFSRRWEHAFRSVLSSSHDGPAADASLHGRRLEPCLVKAGDPRHGRTHVGRAHADEVIEWQSVLLRCRPWLTALLARRPTKVAAIALANKIARMAWAMMARGQHYREPIALAA